MSHYCSICGRELKKTAGPIGPKCLQKLQPRNMRMPRLSKKQHEEICKRYDMYGEDNEQRKTNATGENPKG